MSSEWPQLQLSELVTIKGGKRLPAGNALQQQPNGHPYIRVRDVGQRELPRAGMEYVPDELFPPISRYIVQPNDVVLSIVGTIGALSIVDAKYDQASLTENCVKLHGLGREDALYLFYYLSSPIGQQEIHRGTVGAVQPKLPIYNIEKIKVTWPERLFRAAIAEILGTIDDRIALLRETNTTLEAIAQALFKSWFVDFDPVRAKQQGRPPESLDPATAALFPNDFEDTELGPVPKGWRVGSLDYIADFLNGLALQKFPPTGYNDLPVIKIAQLRKGDTVGADKASSEIKPEYIVQNGDVLFSWSGSLEVAIWCGGIGALNQHLFKVTSNNFPKWFYYFWTRHHLPIFQQIAASKATTMGHIQRKHLTEAKVIIPAVAILKEAEKIFAPLIDQLINNALQAQTLATLRDTLLPRLISGQLRLPEAEALLEQKSA